MNDRRWHVLLVVAAAATVALVAVATDRIFDPPYNPLLAIVAPLLAAAVAVANPWKRILLRVPPQALVCLLVTALAVASRDGELPADIGDGAVRGLARVVGARWPAPSEPVSVAGVVLTVTLAGCIVAELAWSRRYAGVLLAPPVALLVLVALLAPKAGPPSMFLLIPLVALCGVVLRAAHVVRTARVHRDSPTPEQGATALVASVVGLVALLPLAIGAPFGTTDRFDVRDLRNRSANVDEEISLLSRLEEWRSLEPARTMFVVDPVDEEARWRVGALTRYDGRSWMPSRDYRPIGSELGPRLGQLPLERYTVTLGELAEAWVPFTGEPVEVDLSALVDPTRSGIRVDDPFVADESYQITVVSPEPTKERLELANADRDAEITRVVEVPLSAELAPLAARITEGATSDYERAEFLAAHLRDDFVLDPGAPAGHSLAQLRLFLLTSKAGRDEQFVAAYALLARSLNLPVRIAVGFDMTADDEGRSVARSDAVVAWPEIAFERLGWVAFDPLPEEGSVVPEAAAPAGQAEAAPGRQAPPTTAAEVEPDEQDNPLNVEAEQDRDLSVAGRLALAGLMLVVAMAAYVVAVLTMKRNRRARRGAIEQPDARIAGAFLSGVDLAIDLGATAGPTLTNKELAVSSVPVVADGAPELQSLASLATRAVYDAERPTDEVADEAWQREQRMRADTAKGVGWFRWTLARLSPRSLRTPLLDEADQGGAATPPARRGGEAVEAESGSARR